ncbi:hypothetical protein SDJN03_00985, partial [Cucurbita argyrosperma subsp. sororia]
MEDLLGRGEPPGLVARQLEEEAAEQDVESGGHAARDTEQPVNLSARYRKMEDLLGRGEPPGLAARQLEEEAAKQDVESGGHAARDTEPIGLKTEFKRNEIRQI